MKIMAFSPITYDKQMGKQWKQWQTLFSWAPKSLQMVTVAMKLKDACSLEETLWLASVQFSCSVMSDSLWPHGLQHARLPCPSPTPVACSNSCLCHPTISSSVIPFSSHLQSFPTSGSFPMSQFFASVGQSIGVSASASVLPMSIQDWFPLGWTGGISLKSKGLSIILSNTTVQKHWFFGAQLSLWSNSHIHTWLLDKP